MERERKKRELEEGDRGEGEEKERDGEREAEGERCREMTAEEHWRKSESRKDRRTVQNKSERLISSTSGMRTKEK